ncbi:hypothetical protein K402DRAFT_391670 [Aulographum hederae CBS 113979]|uniref:Uncharacterized protein n=1 Tax=Aulographum hederae CBS 113979 TaxID=1176131 RepID=A0A6G1H612_9PEZI|nr:hypothetical protein K402DRAFT_391670 [Aulographum hederae CBS 113979]
MLFKSLIAVAAFSASFAMADETPTMVTISATSFSPEQSSAIVSDLSAYLTSLTAQPEYTSVASVLATAIPADELADIDELVTATTYPSWYTSLPDDAQAYLNSIGIAEASIINKDVAGAAPTAAPMLKYVGGAAGIVAAGAAALL